MSYQPGSWTIRNGDKSSCEVFHIEAADVIFLSTKTAVPARVCGCANGNEPPMTLTPSLWKQPPPYTNASEMISRLRMMA
jgi:hypothetical protein